MPSVDRYFLDSPIQSGAATLSGDEAHHLIHVMRAKPGTAITLFSGNGMEYDSKVESVGRNVVRLTVLSHRPVDRELTVDLTLGVALPKGERQKWLVEKAVELGVTRIVPLRTARSVAQPVAQALGRLRRSVIEASKQCGRNRLMEIAEPRDWGELVAGTPEVACRLVAHPAGRGTEADGPLAVAFSRDPLRAGSFLLAVGPEGGFTSEEVALATCAGWRTVDLGPRILRVETAGLVLVTMVLARLPCGGG